MRQTWWNHTNGRNLSLKILRLGYYWMTLRHDALDYAKRCNACQRHSPIIHQPFEHLNMSIPSCPFMKWGMDIMGKMPHAPGQKVFMLAMTDYFSKWTETEAFKQVTSKETPYSLVYGTKAVFPTEVMMPTARYGLLTSDMNNKELSHDKDTMDKLWKMAKISLVSYQQRVANTYNKHVHIRTFRVGNIVLRKTFQNTVDVTAGKFADTWEGPYFIDDIVGHGDYRLSNMDGTQGP
ncbi:uncharacterized protein LOC141695907 [Apium graveolens]|uniref:uncharacterized protein LOC141695907 n=1 Tax=Apium graveolens TaxID=4045 RepID=UPI003D78C36B